MYTWMNNAYIQCIHLWIHAYVSVAHEYIHTYIHIRDVYNPCTALHTYMAGWDGYMYNVCVVGVYILICTYTYIRIHPCIALTHLYCIILTYKWVSLRTQRLRWREAGIEEASRHGRCESPWRCWNNSRTREWTQIPGLAIARAPPEWIPAALYTRLTAKRKKDILTSSNAKFGPWDNWFTTKEYLSSKI